MQRMRDCALDAREVLLGREREEAARRRLGRACDGVHELVSLLVAAEPLLYPLLLDGLEARPVAHRILPNAQHAVVVRPRIPACATTRSTSWADRASLRLEHTSRQPA
jgi:hypothetical protein